MPAREADASNGPSAQLGRYTLTRRIGKGGMGEVWLGKVSGAHGFEKAVAIKRILPQFSSNVHVVNMLVDEARICVSLNHPNVVQVLELGEDRGDYFIVMEFVDGHALSRLLRKLKNGKRRLEILEACYVAIHLLEGLHAAHVQKDHRGKPAGIIHRDVSPQNVLLSLDGVVKVIDFGIARAKERLEVTQGTSVKGKLRYMAPEQLSSKLIRGKSLDHRADVFAAGIVLFEMLAMRQRFGGDKESDIMDAILKEETPDLAREGLIDRELMDIVDTALEKNRDERFPDAATFAGKLRNYLYKRDPSFTADRIARRMREAFAVDGDGDDKDTREVDQRGKPVAPVVEVDDEQTRTTFRPDVNSSVNAVANEAAVRAAQGLSSIEARPRSRWPAATAGLLVGAALIGGGYLAIRPHIGPATLRVDAGAVLPATMELLVEADPPTTRIIVEQHPEQRYVSPAKLRATTGDNVALLFEADGYQSQKHVVFAQPIPAGLSHLSVKLEPLMVELTVRVVPKDASVTVNGVAYKPGMMVVPGDALEVRAEHPFAAAAKATTVSARAGEPLTIDLVLDSGAGQTKGARPSRGTLMLSSDPAGADVFIDGRKVPGRTPVEIGMAAGAHKVIVRAGESEQSFAVDIHVGERARRDISLR